MQLHGLSTVRRSLPNEYPVHGQRCIAKDVQGHQTKARHSRSSGRRYKANRGSKYSKGKDDFLNLNLMELGVLTNKLCTLVAMYRTLCCLISVVPLCVGRLCVAEVTTYTKWNLPLVRDF